MDDKQIGAATPDDDRLIEVEGAAENLCPQCSGKGEVEGRECPTCGGTGKVVEEIGGA
jgi:DnaJ-class molecular chaperone